MYFRKKQHVTNHITHNMNEQHIMSTHEQVLNFKEDRRLPERGRDKHSALPIDKRILPGPPDPWNKSSAGCYVYIYIYIYISHDFDGNWALTLGLQALEAAAPSKASAQAAAAPVVSRKGGRQ